MINEYHFKTNLVSPLQDIALSIPKPFVQIDKLYDSVFSHVVGKFLSFLPAQRTSFRQQTHCLDVNLQELHVRKPLCKCYFLSSPRINDDDAQGYNRCHFHFPGRNDSIIN